MILYDIIPYYHTISFHTVLIVGALDIICKEEEESYSKQCNVY